MPFMGVRISWLMLARKRLLAWLASTATWRACSRAAATDEASRRRRVISVQSRQLRQLSCVSTTP
jgi:hypothetical protein